ncbi:trypsin-like cysteine/serine peptidase domain-containing protein [Aspergillus minisclerotigenes]|uniref:Trypsin-like cysteine/serine peptidase domain-containing protein n=1 Tax=Aspergillus minisclerotigenes TaxID=656917 RepID=A0A5N6IXE1_9EURO|nr:trypsin-like cysteine/serine peptidase domain-containing protein [Aspergillus minisclerotigenes]
MRPFTIISLLGVALWPPVSAIVNGIEASAVDYPYMAGLLSAYLSGISYQFRCGGTVIGRRTVLTSGFCVEGLSAGELKVRVGSAHRNKGGTVVRVSKIITHPNYNSNTFDYDYAIVHLEADVPFAAALLPETDPALTNDPAVRVAGWGSQDSTLTIPTMLQTADMLIVDRSTCDSAWNDLNSITSSMICVSSNEAMPGTSVCRGDLGGPIVDEARLTLYGVVSLQVNCSAVPRPNIASSVFKVKSWIEGNLI